jgi:hypothetical protein
MENVFSPGSGLAYPSRRTHLSSLIKKRIWWKTHINRNLVYYSAKKQLFFSPAIHLAHACCFYIASTLPGCCSDGRFEDFPGEFDEF